ncbi:hypothetical protein V5P93_003449 [Actinokineospora auranticolor]|uniref:Uncharacterized protein n=1 Tax=Actinokineospora auranticolor TaxID=155976 RepID=A0A2S6GPG5_9PSEU|nr:hypothetical protein [Actinokineospora auranticolor]PPK67109.1 hypothetical protein CLV40_108106 [Actinokineospora auranticolor]
MTMSTACYQESTEGALLAALVDIADESVVFHNRLGFRRAGVELTCRQTEVVRALLRRGVAVIESGDHHDTHAPVLLTGTGTALLQRNAR